MMLSALLLAIVDPPCLPLLFSSSPDHSIHSLLSASTASGGWGLRGVRAVSATVPQAFPALPFLPHALTKVTTSNLGFKGTHQYNSCVMLILK